MASDASVTQHGSGSHHEHEHPGPRTYMVIAAILFILTAAEVAVFYIEVLRPVLVPILLVLTAGKFFLVVLFYMHLRFDDRLFGWVFYMPLVLATLVIIALIIIKHVLPLYIRI